MQPFVNPNYYLANPYLQNQTIYQQPVQQPYSSLSGKYVNDFAEITANDVPMNGIPAIFAKNDRSEIQLREWSPNGQIVSTTYKAILDENKTEANILLDETEKAKFDVLEKKLDAIESKLEKILKPSKKEVAKDES